MSNLKKLEGIRHAVSYAKSQKNLADALGVSKVTVNRWVRLGYVTDKEKIELIYEKYGIHPARLFDPDIVKLIALTKKKKEEGEEEEE